jgi:hypothetical protein
MDSHHTDRFCNKGNIAALSLISVPALIRSKSRDHVPSTTLAKQWRYIFESGKSQNPPIAAITASAFAYLAWSVRSGGMYHHMVPKMSMQLYCAAAILTLGIVPFTIVAMRPTNNKLIEKAETSSKQTDTSPLAQSNEDEIDNLIAKWKSLNGIRSLLPLLGGILGLGAALA